ncbi:hypothetical protein [Pontimicrobium sp. MEBiC01747]
MQEHYKVYVLFDITVAKSRKYKAKPKSSDFDTKEEAITERDSLYKQGVYKHGTLKVMMLWRSKKQTK